MDLLAADDTGSSDLDNVTARVNDVPFTVTSDIGSEVIIKDGNTVIDGPFISTGSDVRNLTLAEGSHLLSAEATDVAGNVSAQSEELVVTIDRIAPIAPSNVELLTSSDTFDNFTTTVGQMNPIGSDSDGITKLNQPAIIGTGEPNAKVRVLAAQRDPVTGLDIGPQRLIGEGVVNTDGVWEITVEPLADDYYNLYSIQEDLAGNVSPLATQTLNFANTTATPINEATPGSASSTITFDVVAAPER